MNQAILEKANSTENLHSSNPTLNCINTPTINVINYNNNLESFLNEGVKPGEIVKPEQVELSEKMDNVRLVDEAANSEQQTKI